MKLTSHKTTRTGDKVTVEAKWISKFKKPLQVTTTVWSRPDETGVRPLMEGDVLDVHGFLFGCAAIAWSLGWRPAGFLKAMNAWVADYEPKP